MNFTKSVFSYYFKNFFELFVIVIVPVVFIAFTLSPFSFVGFLANYMSTPVSNFGDIFLSIVPFSWLGLLYFCIAVVLLIVFGSILFSKIEVHFRTGKFQFRPLRNPINNNILVMLKTVLIILFVSIVFICVGCLLVLLTHVIFAGAGNPANLGALLSAITVFAVLLLLYIQALNLILAAAADMIIMGSPLGVAYSNALKMVGERKFGVVSATLCPVLIALAFSAFGVFVGASWLTNCFALLICLPCFIILSLILFFRHYALSREDEKKTFFN